MIDQIFQLLYQTTKVITLVQVEGKERKKVMKTFMNKLEGTNLGGSPMQKRETDGIISDKSYTKASRPPLAPVPPL